MSIVSESTHHIRDISVQDSVIHHLITELIELRLSWQFTMDQQESDLEEA